MSANQGHASSPADLVETVFFRIQQTRMADVPILNPALSVEAVDFQRWQGHWLGILVSPWCMSVLLIPGQDADWQAVADNTRRFVRFPAGEFAFLGSHEEGLGEFQSCALFSPMERFTSQAEAVQTARAALFTLLQAAAGAPDSHQAAAAEPATATAQAPVSLSRRRFLSLRMG